MPSVSIWSAWLGNRLPRERVLPEMLELVPEEAR